MIFSVNYSSSGEIHKDEPWWRGEIEISHQNKRILSRDLLKASAGSDIGRLYFTTGAECWLAETIEESLVLNKNKFWQAEGPVYMRLDINPWPAVDNKVEEFDLIFFIDAYCFEGDNSTKRNQEGVSIHLICEKSVLKQFVQDLKCELNDFMKAHDIHYTPYRETVKRVHIKADLESSLFIDDAFDGIRSLQVPYWLADRFDEWVNEYYTSKDTDEYYKKGKEIAVELKNNLGPNVKVFYYDEEIQG